LMHYQGCTVEGHVGPSVCGTKAGTCHVCSDGEAEEQHECVGTCTILVNGLAASSQQSCTSNNGLWTPLTWSLNTSATTKAACHQGAYCGKCYNASMGPPSNKQGCMTAGKCVCTTNPCPNDKNSCTTQGHTWYDAYWVKDYSVSNQDLCNAKNTGGVDGWNWRKTAKFEEGDKIKAAPMTSMQECSTGPDHDLSGLVEESSRRRRVPASAAELAELCMNDTLYVQDALADKTALQAADANPVYYRTKLAKTWMSFSRAIVTNNATNVGDRARININPTACFFGLLEPKNKGAVNVNAGANTNILIYKPTNYADADRIAVTGGKARVLGGSNAGAIVINTDKKIELYDLSNTGPVTASGSQDVFIGKVINGAGGSVQVTDVSATLIDVVNEVGATVTVKGPAQGVAAQGGKYNAYYIVNKGTITIEAGVINIHTVCPTSGTLTSSAGVTGNVTYEAGCMGTHNLPSSGVTVSSSTKQQTVIQGTLGLTVPDADTFLADTVAKNAVVAGIAETAGCPSSWVAIQVVKVRRLNDEGLRRLAGTAVTVTYTITVPQTESSAKASLTSTKMQSATTALLTTKIQTKVTTAKGAGFTVSVSSKAAPSVSQVPATTTTTAPASTTVRATTTMSKSGVGSTGAGITVMPSLRVMALLFAFWAWWK